VCAGLVVSRIMRGVPFTESDRFDPVSYKLLFSLHRV